jgi:transposase
MSNARPAALVLPETLPAAHALLQDLHLQLQQRCWELDQLKKQIFGSSADRASLPEAYSKEQILMDLFPAPGQPPATQGVVESQPETSSKSESKGKPKTPLIVPQAIQTVTQRIEPEEKICPHCGIEKCEIGCERSERFDYIPAQIIRKEILRPKLACPCGQGTVVIAPLPPVLIEKGKADSGLVAQVILSKYDDHIPLYRQEQQFARLGVHFPRQTLCDWVERGAFWLQGLVRVMNQELLAGNYLQVDETPVKVLDPEVKGKAATGYLWVKAHPKGDVIFEFHPGRSKECGSQVIGSFEGKIQRDGYGVYSSLEKSRPKLIGVGCWSHARRKFVDALEEAPEQAQWFVGQIRKLYVMESLARDKAMTAEQRQRMRQELGPPIMESIKARLDQLYPSLLPQNPLGKALKYALSEWVSLQRYLEDGQLEIDNNLTENAIRPSAVGKKNWLFLGHPEAAWKSAVIYSIIGSCRRRGIDPWRYLKDVLARLPSATTTDLPNLIPAHWKPQER